jgi:signal peptidase I
LLSGSVKYSHSGYEAGSMQFIRNFVLTLVAIAAVVLLLRLAAGTYVIENDMMSPGLETGERILINKLAYQNSEPNRGDIICYQSSDRPAPGLLRIIGLPGDIVKIQDKAVFINSTKLYEPYVNNPPAYNILTYQVPANTYFVLPDNRSADITAATWILPRDDILGHASVFIWPPNKWDAVDNYPLDSQLSSAELPDPN